MNRQFSPCLPVGDKKTFVEKIPYLCKIHIEIPYTVCYTDCYEILI